MDVYNINEVSEQLGLNKHTLRKWERDFELKIPRGNVGNRYYTNKEVKLISNIKNWKEKGLDKENINNYLSTLEVEDECAVSLVKVEQISVEELQETMVVNLKSAMSEIIGDIVIEREESLKKEFENTLENKLDEVRGHLTEEITHNIKRQVHAENQKLMLYLSSLREENKKGFFGRLIGNK